MEDTGRWIEVIDLVLRARELYNALPEEEKRKAGEALDKIEEENKESEITEESDVIIQGEEAIGV